MCKSVGLFIIGVFFLCRALLAAQSGEVRDFSEELWHFDTETGVFLPSFKTNTPDPALLGFYLDLNNANPESVTICAPLETAVWVNNQLFISKTTSPCITNNLSDWSKKFGTDSVFVVLHNPEGLLEATSIKQVLQFADQQSESIQITPRPRSGSSLVQFLLSFVILYLTILGFFRLQFSRIFKSVVNLNRVFSLRVRDEMMTGFRLFSLPSVSIHLLVSILIGFFLLVFEQSNFSNEPTDGLLKHIANWLGYSLWILLFLLSRRLLIQVFGELFKMRGAVYLQVFEYLRTIFLIFSAVLITYVLSFYLWSPGAQWIAVHLPAFLSITILAAFLLVFYKLAFETSYHKLHLFSYLCATEILPAILLIKWIVD